jgi:hypothetical protein
MFEVKKTISFKKVIIGNFFQYISENIIFVNIYIYISQNSCLKDFVNFPSIISCLKVPLKFQCILKWFLKYISEFLVTFMIIKD